MAVRSGEQDGSGRGAGVVEGRATIDWASTEPVVEAVIDALVDATGTDAVDLDPLFEYVDPDALTALFRPASNGTLPAVTAVRFGYGEYAVTVARDGDVVVIGD
ncbi:HalOD1 output domain-containing protein [Halomarina pelagica]|uniref:HalOD1 output domain-containing protein n=1 Tax=Halomarina pelagica TaxID=2961599 RepID=UPI0020C2CDA7|nr:HalOD1 output domain-containing protein [Halomarina sp. BND7]